ncbi:TPA: tyrosine-type recombinase/integrase [Haemophilus influenzae]
MRDYVLILSLMCLMQHSENSKKLAEREYLHFHDTRRKALTRLSKKVDVMTLAKISGHKDISILQNVYYALIWRRWRNYLIS